MHLDRRVARIYVSQLRVSEGRRYNGIAGGGRGGEEVSIAQPEINDPRGNSFQYFRHTVMNPFVGAGLSRRWMLAKNPVNE